MPLVLSDQNSLPMAVSPRPVPYMTCTPPLPYIGPSWKASRPSPGTPMARSSRPSWLKSPAASVDPKASYFSASPATPGLFCV